MVRKPYIPDRGDIVWLDFTSHAGHEQMGKRPALVVSFKEYNSKVGLAICCPITSKVKGYPFEVAIQQGKIKGAVLSDQLKSCDWNARKIEFIAKIKENLLKEVVSKISVLILD